MSNRTGESLNQEFDPLEYHTIADTVVAALLKRQMDLLPLETSFAGAGVYLIYYRGTFAPYGPISNTDVPIYVGKAMPPGSRRGPAALRQIENTTAPALWNRLRDHTSSIDAADNIDLSDFRCRYLVVTPIWITIAESLLIARFHPVWNSVVDGFGLHDPGTTRRSQRRSDWDTIHPGRRWAPLMQTGKSTEVIIGEIGRHFSQ